MLTIEIEGLERLLTLLKARGFGLLGPTIRSGAIVFDTIVSTQDLPAGWTDEQESASYRLVRRADGAFFGYTIGPVSWKKFLLPRVRLFAARRNGRGFDVVTDQRAEAAERCPIAFIGIRSCELHTLALHDRVFMQGEQADPTYRAIRESTFIVAVDCLQPGGTCFCTSMKTGPAVSAGFDLALSELTGPAGHRFLVRAGSANGEELLGQLGGHETTPEDAEECAAAVAAAAASMRRTVDVKHLGPALFQAFEDPEWDDVAKRCLACANCTMVCPTCFCSTVEDATDPAGSTPSGGGGGIPASRWISRGWQAATFVPPPAHATGSG